jgi:hypothetical protein
MNTNPLSTTGISLFFATNSYKPQISFDLQLAVAPLPPKDAREKRERQRTKELARSIQDQAQYLQEQITLAQSRMA